MFSLRDLGLIFTVVLFAVMAVVMVRDLVRYVHQLRCDKASLAAKVTTLEAQVNSLTKTRQETIEEALEIFSRRMNNKSRLEALIARDALDLIWQTNPATVRDIIQEFVAKQKAT